MSQQSDIAYKKIRSKIFHMELKPGDRISELKMSKEIEISRTPIHDAIRRLESEGLVIVKPNSGAQVRNISDNEIKELGIIRLSQDILAANLASYYGSASDFARLDAFADACDEALKSNDKYQRIWQDIQLHLEIANISHNASLIKLQHNIYQQVHLILVNKLTRADTVDPTEGHRAIIAAIRSGKPDTISRAICMHLKDMYLIDDYFCKQYCG